MKIVLPSTAGGDMTINGSFPGPYHSCYSSSYLSHSHYFIYEQCMLTGNFQIKRIRDKASIARAITLEIKCWNVLIFLFFKCSICKASGAIRSLYPRKLALGLKTKGIGQSWWVWGVVVFICL